MSELKKTLLLRLKSHGNMSKVLWTKRRVTCMRNQSKGSRKNSTNFRAQFALRVFCCKCAEEEYSNYDTLAGNIFVTNSVLNANPEQLLSLAVS